MKRAFGIILFLYCAPGLAEQTSLRFIKDVNFPTGYELDGTVMGGLSGIYYDQSKKQLIAISDDKGAPHKKDNRAFAPRIYAFDILLKERESTIVPRSTSPLKMEFVEGEPDQTFPAHLLDPEGLALAPDGSLLVSSEGLGAYVPPMILRFSPALYFEERLPVPERYIPRHADKGDEIEDLRGAGVQWNAAFEALTFSSDAQTLFVASEYGLKQDMPEGKRRNQFFSRILTYRQKGTEYQPGREFLYPNDDYYSGLVDFVALGDSKLLTLERMFINGKNTIKIFETDLASATDVSGLDKITDLSVIALAKKRLVLDLDAIIDQLDPAHRELDNIEGISFGPKLPNGNGSLIVVSDNNFLERQRTVFLIFELIRK